MGFFDKIDNVSGSNIIKKSFIEEAVKCLLRVLVHAGHSILLIRWNVVNDMKYGACRMRRIYIDVLIYRKSCCLQPSTAAMLDLQLADT